MRTDIRRLCAFALTVALVASLVPLAGPAGAVGTFDDDDGNIHEDNIEKIAALGITKGCNPPENNLYCPDDLVTRQQMASFLVRTFDLPPAPPGQFTDTEGSVHEADIDALSQSGITRGCNPPDNTEYCPLDLVTRGQMAAFMARGLGLDDVSEDFFGDDDGDIFELQINAIARVGITKGCNPPENTEYCPDNPVRRDEMASFLSRVADIVTTGTTSTTTPAGTPTTTTTSTIPTTTTSLPGVGRGLFSSDNADRQPAVVLEGETLTGNAFVFAGPDEGVTQTQFYIDDPDQSGSPYRVEDFSKFDLEGTAPDGSANPYDTFKLQNGSHDISAVMVLEGGGTETYNSTVTVANAPAVWLAGQSVSFNLAPGASSGTPKGIVVDSNNGGAINWTATENAPWLTLVNATGVGGEQVTFDASAAGLTPGVLTTTVTVSAPGYQSETFTVTMNVLAVGSCPSPHGTDVAVTPPYSLGFGAAIGGTVNDIDTEGTGFTCVQATSNGEGYISSNLSLDTSGGTLSITTTDGIAIGTGMAVNDQDNALGVGFDGGGATTLSTTLLSPPWEGNGGFEQAGLWAGIDEDNYVKAVLMDRPEGNAVVLQAETGASPSTEQLVLLPVSPAGSLQLVLVVNDADNTASLSYSLDGGALALVGTVPVAQVVFDGVDPDGASSPSGVNTLGGIFASHRTGTQKTYTFDQFTLTKP